jgi:archaellum component FlaC
MNRSLPATFKPTFIFTAFMGGLLLTSCGSVSEKSAPSMMSQAPPAMKTAATQPKSDNRAAEEAPDTPGKSEGNATNAQVPKQRTQLIKTAEMSLKVDSIEKTLQTISKLVQQKQGDVLSLQDDKPQDNVSRHLAYMQLRVPQEKLEVMLDELALLGTVQNRNIKADDVTNQLVDTEARLRNLRKQEATLLKIMERSGSVGDVLRVAQELSNVRQTIEQIDAQLKNLRNQVAYSTIRLRLMNAVVPLPSQPPLDSQVKETWNQATHAVGSLTTTLIKLIIWLAAFSPYILVAGGSIYGLNRFRNRQSRSSS